MIQFADTAGNTGTGVTAITSGSNVTFDKTVPTLTSVTIASNNSTPTKAKVGDILTLSLTGSEAFLTAPVVTIAGHTVVATGAANVYTATYTMSGTDSEGTVPFTINFSDLSSNS